MSKNEGVGMGFNREKLGIWWIRDVIHNWAFRQKNKNIRKSEYGL
jgi:hypothetical protein